jgi:AbiV
MADYVLSQQQLKDGHNKCLENVQKLLDNASLLLETETGQQFALGLYMYAIEEYGKAEILRDCIEGKKIPSLSGYLGKVKMQGVVMRES